MFRSFTPLALGLIVLATTISRPSFAQESCPVMEDAFFALSRTAQDLTLTRFDEASQIIASQVLVGTARAQVSASMNQKDCIRHSQNPLPLYDFGSYKGNCPVIESTKNYIKRTLIDFTNVRPIFREDVVQPRALLLHTLQLLEELRKIKGCN